MKQFIDEVMNLVTPKAKPQVLQELIEPENYIPDEETDTTAESNTKAKSVQED